jgi:Ca2+-transporting ATPase
MKFLTISQKEDREVKALRSGRPVMISVWDVMVGDVLYLGPGDVVPASVVINSINSSLGSELN